MSTYEQKNPHPKIGRIELSAAIDENRNISDEVKNALSRGVPVSLRCGVVAKSGPYIKDGRITINPNEPTFCFFRFVEEELEKRYDNDGKRLGQMLSLLSQTQAIDSHLSRNMQALLEGMSVFSVGESLDIRTFDILDYIENWKINYENIGGGVCNAATKRMGGYIDLTTDNPKNCDYVWAYNVIPLR